MSARTIPMTEPLHAYLLAHGVREPEVARRLREHTQTMEMARMQISPEQGAFLGFLVRALGVRRAIEVGTFTGYSALVTALALPEDGQLLCCDVSREWTDVGRPYWQAAGVADRIDLRLAPAAETLASLRAEGLDGTVDFAFVDADKPGYAAYIDLLHGLLRPGGVIGIDNVLWSGRVADPADTSEDTVALRALNAALATDARWDLSMVPIGDGLTLLRKR